MRNFFTLIFFTFSLLLSAQQRRENPAFTIRGNIGIPKTVSSQMFRTAFNGVYEGNLSLNLKLFSNFFGGIGYQNSHFQNNKKVFAFYQSKTQKQQLTGAFLSYNTRMVGHSGFLKLGYDQFFEKGYVSYSLNSGYMMAHYKNVEPDSLPENRPFVSKNYSAPYVQPEIAINFLADRSISFSLMLSYTTLFYKFDPKAPRFNGVKDVRDAKNNYAVSWFNIGFGFNILINSKK